MTQDEKNSFGTKVQFIDPAAQQAEKLRKEEGDRQNQAGVFFEDHKTKLHENLNEALGDLGEQKKEAYYKLSLMLLPPKVNTDEALAVRNLVSKIAKYNEKGEGYKKQIQKDLNKLLDGVKKWDPKRKNKFNDTLAEIKGVIDIEQTTWNPKTNKLEVSDSNMILPKALDIKTEISHGNVQYQQKSFESFPSAKALEHKGPKSINVLSPEFKQAPGAKQINTGGWPSKSTTEITNKEAKSVLSKAVKALKGAAATLSNKISFTPKKKGNYNLLDK